ncbi:hypothetical protein GCM10011419_22270 [Vogesella fluminis]|uniref:Flagellar protein FlaG n=1 Tax=Vogesella fluminis TaxID=1069161 RepID=A0ABQ3HD43_9NEIS|nr:hypothetical protein GCM10011419_22270 [Vogesella fluminis]
MSSLSPLLPVATPAATPLSDTAGRTAPLPAQQASAPTVPVSASAVQALSSTAAGSQGKNVADKEELTQATEKISKLVATFASELNFSIDEDLGVPVVKVIDKHTDKVIRQIPTEEVLEMSKNLDKLVGVLYQSKA